ncbi:MAG: T9SS type A sorting domain-containing protein [Bacteroidetes bacterium]|nr:T9SS type A sorting domain-containing protein [Bacteroidota bacterium]
MKKIYLLLVAVSFVAANSFAQQRIAKAKSMNITVTAKQQPAVQPMNVIDTIANHWDPIFPQPAVDTAVTYNSGSGYVAGQNDYGDIGKMQKFDATYGITSASGSITNLLLWFGAKTQIAGTAAFTATIWADAAGVPGAVLGTAPVFTISQIDTAAASLGLIGSPLAVEGAFNVNAAFSPAIAIPANQTFWAGITFTYANGDSAGLVSSRDGVPADGIGTTGNFLAASTHTFEKWSDNSYHSFNDGTTSTWQLDIALAVYPVIDFATGVNENSHAIAALQNYPNPASNNTMIYYSLKESANVEFSLFDVAGKKLSALSQGVQSSGNHQFKFDASNLSSGVYFYTLTAGNNKMTSKMSVVK